MSTDLETCVLGYFGGSTVIMELPKPGETVEQTRDRALAALQASGVRAFGVGQNGISIQERQGSAYGISIGGEMVTYTSEAYGDPLVLRRLGSRHRHLDCPACDFGWYNADRERRHYGMTCSWARAVQEKVRARYLDGHSGGDE